VPVNDRVLVDFRTADDAGVYRLDAERAIVQTVDFFTPIVDDPFVFGQIAAANALSDVYAMGGRALTALAIAGFPNEADRALLKAIFAGGLDVLERAGVALLGGHTVQDPEIKFGYAVTGEVHPDRVWSNAGARAGDVLLLTKPIGTGIISTALKFGRAPDAAVRGAIASMIAVNRDACEAMRALPPDSVHACTDITGFGLAGHASEVAAASGVALTIDAGRVPLLDGVRPLVPGNVPGGGRTNLAHFGAGVRLARDIDTDLVQLLYDPQTSGGLLFVVSQAAAGLAEAALREAGVAAHRIGEVVPPAEGAATRVIVR
jgi:selenide,water dikinase